jgi:Tfp pilus assembly protein PilV
MNIKPLQEANGFALIEILIATVIITTVTLGVVTLTVGIMRGNSFSKRLTTASTLVQDQLEDLKRLGYANVGIAAGTQNYGTIANFSGYKRVVTVTNDIPAAKMKTVNELVASFRHHRTPAY